MADHARARMSPRRYKDKDARFAHGVRTGNRKDLRAPRAGAQRAMLKIYH
jgi:hypothetical protein